MNTNATPILEVKGLKVHFETPRGTVRAVDGGTSRWPR